MFGMDRGFGAQSGGGRMGGFGGGDQQQSGMKMGGSFGGKPMRQGMQTGINPNAPQSQPMGGGDFGGMDRQPQRQQPGGWGGMSFGNGGGMPQRGMGGGMRMGGFGNGGGIQGGGMRFGGSFGGGHGDQMQDYRGRYNQQMQAEQQMGNPEPQMQDAPMQAAPQEQHDYYGRPEDRDMYFKNMGWA